MSGLKRFVLFAGDNYYPLGGCDDYIATSDDMEELKTMFIKDEQFVGYGWAHILDTDTMRVVERFELQDRWLPCNGEDITERPKKIPEPPEVAPSPVTGQGEPMTVSEFDSLSPKDRMKFMKSGGRVVPDPEQIE